MRMLRIPTLESWHTYMKRISWSTNRCFVWSKLHRVSWHDDFIMVIASLRMLRYDWSRILLLIGILSGRVCTLGYVLNQILLFFFSLKTYHNQVFLMLLVWTLWASRLMSWDNANAKIRVGHKNLVKSWTHPAMPVYRLHFSLMIVEWCWAICIFVWNRYVGSSSLSLSLSLTHTHTQQVQSELRVHDGTSSTQQGTLSRRVRECD